MAIAISSEPDYLVPVYSVQEYTLYDAANYSEDGFYYQLDVSIDGETRTLKTQKDANNKAVIDVQAILQAFIESEFIESAGTICSAYFDFVKDYQVRAGSHWDDGDSVGSWQTAKKVFNGVDRYDREWDASIYEIRADSSSLFLTSDHEPRDIYLDGHAFLMTLWDYGNIDTSFNGVTIKRYNYDGDVSTYLSNFPMSDYGFDVPVKICVDPSTINNVVTDFITADTEYYTVQSLNELSEIIRFNVKEKDKRYERNYEVQYIDHLGVTCNFNFDLVPENNINISRTTYVNDRVTRSFNTEVEDNYLVRSGFMCQAKSKALKDLWYSPKAAVVESWGNPYDIVINESSKQILNRHNQELINYTFNFRYANNFIVQFQ